MSDEEIRDLIAQVENKPFLTKAEEDAVIARLQPAIDERLKREGQKSIVGKQPDTGGEPDLTDEQLRELLAPLREAHLPTPGERKEILARLKPIIKRQVKLEGPNR